MICQMCGAEFQREGRQASTVLCAACDSPHMRWEYHRWQRNERRAPAQDGDTPLTFADWIAMLVHFRLHCAYHPRPANVPYGWASVLEHITPVSVGGRTTIDNCVPACFQCNAVKRHHSPDECPLPPVAVNRARRMLKEFCDAKDRLLQSQADRRKTCRAFCDMCEARDRQHEARGRRFGTGLRVEPYHRR